MNNAAKNSTIKTLLITDLRHYTKLVCFLTVLLEQNGVRADTIMGPQ